MTSFYSGALLIATMALTALALGIVVYACTRRERPSEFEKPQRANARSTSKALRRYRRPY